MGVTLEELFGQRESQGEVVVAPPRPAQPVTPQSGTESAPASTPPTLEQLFGGGATRTQSRTPGRTYSRTEVEQMIVAAARKYGVPPHIALAVASHESGGFAPDVISGTRRGTSGEIGVMQLMPATAKGLGIADPFDVTQNIDGGVRNLASNFRTFHSWPQAIMAYNAGEGAVKSGRVPQSTRNTYLPAIIKNMGYYVRRLPSFIGEVAGALPREFVPGFESGATLGFVRPPQTKTTAEKVAAGVGELAGTAVPFAAAGLIPGVAPLEGALGTAARFGAMGAGRAGIAAARGEAPVSEIPMEAAREAVLGFTGDVVLRVAGRAVAVLAGRLRIPVRQAAEQIAQEANTRVRAGETPPAALKTALALPAPESPRGLLTPPGPRGAAVPEAPSPAREYDGSEAMQARIASLARRGGLPPDELANRLIQQAEDKRVPLGAVVSAIERVTGAQRAGVAAVDPTRIRELQSPELRARIQALARRTDLTAMPLKPFELARQFLQQAEAKGVSLGEVVQTAEDDLASAVGPTEAPSGAIAQEQDAFLRHEQQYAQQQAPPEAPSPTETPAPPLPGRKPRVEHDTGLGFGKAGFDAAETDQLIKTNPGARNAILSRARGALDAAGGNLENAIALWGRSQSVHVSPRRQIWVTAEGIRPILQRIVQGRSTVRISPVEDPEELARAASGPMVSVIAREIGRMASLASAQASRSEGLAEQRLVESAELGTTAGRAARSKQLLAREHEAMAGHAGLFATEAEARIEAVKAAGLRLPPIPKVPTREELEVAIELGRSGDISSEIERAATAVGDANRTLSDATGGFMPDIEETPGPARRYLRELDMATRRLGELQRTLEERGSGLSPNLIEEIKKSLGTGRIGIVAPGSEMLIQAMSPLAKAWDAIRTWRGWAEYIIPMQSVIRKAPSGIEAIDRMDAAEQGFHRGLGALNDLFRRTLTLSKEQTWNLRAVMEARATARSPRIAAIAEEWTQYFKRLATQAERSGFLIFDPQRQKQIAELRALIRDGHKPSPAEWEAITQGPYRPWQPREHYFPVVYREGIGRSPQKTEQIRQALMQRARARGFDDDSARTIADGQMDSILKHHGRRFGHLEMARTAELPDQFREEPQIELAQYVIQAEKALSLANSFGRHVPVQYGEDTHLEWEGARSLMTQMRDEGHPDAASLFEHAFRVYAGEGGFDSLGREFLGGVHALNRINVMLNMSLSALWKITQPFSNAPIRTSWRTFIGGLFDIMKNPREGFRFARESGALIDDVIQEVARQDSRYTLDRWSRQALTLYGFVPAVTWSRAVAAATGRRYARQLFDQLVRNPGSQAARRDLTEILGEAGVARALQAGQLTSEDYLNAGFKIARDIEFLGRVDRYPNFWNTPHGQLVTLYHRFTAQQAQFILREIRRRPLHFFATAIPTWFVVGDAAQTLSEKVRGRERPFVMAELYDWAVLGKQPDVPTRVLMEQAAQSLAGWSVLGLFGDVMRNIAAGQARTLELVTGPTVGEASQVGYHGYRAAAEEYAIRMGLRSPERRTGLAALERDISRHVPFFGARLSQTFRTPHERWVLTRDAAIKAWDAQDLSTFMDLQGQLADMGRALNYNDLVKHEQNRARQEAATEEGVPVSRPLPGESDYVPAGR
jgi:hypothetical protein